MASVKLDTNFQIKVTPVRERNELDGNGRAVIDSKTKQLVKADPEVELSAYVEYEIEETAETSGVRVTLTLDEGDALTMTLAGFRTAVKADAQSKLESLRGKTHTVTDKVRGA